MSKLYELQQEMKAFLVKGEKKDGGLLTEEACDELEVYKGLVRSAADRLLTSVYPLVNKLLKPNWHLIVNKYLKTSPPRDPRFNFIAREFAKFLQQEGLDPDYIAELAWYEWLEVELFNAPDMQKETGITPAYIICNFTYPISTIVEELKKDNLSFKTEATPEQILIYRDETDRRVKFFSLAPTTSLVLQLLDQGMAFDEMAKEVITTFQLPEDLMPKLKEDLTALIAQLKERHILL